MRPRRLCQVTEAPESAPARLTVATTHLCPWGPACAPLLPGTDTRSPRRHTTPRRTPSVVPARGLCRGEKGKSGERGQISALGTFFEITFFLLWRTPISSAGGSWLPPTPTAHFRSSLASKGKGRPLATLASFPFASQFGSRLSDLVFIYSIYLFIGFQDARGWWRSAPAKRQPLATAAPGSWARQGPGQWRWLSSALGCRAPGAVDCWLWRCARWRSACSPTFGPPSCRPECCAWKRSAGSSRWRKLFWDESTNCWTRFVPFVAAFYPHPEAPPRAVLGL